MRLDSAVLADRIVLAATTGFALAAFVLLLRESLGLPPAAAVAVAVYGATLAASAISSLIYNIGHKHRPAGFWRFADHVCIFLLIAGTYTPFSILGEAGRSAWLLIPVWSVAGLGCALKLALGLRYERWFLLLYLVMGWMVLFGLDSVIASLSPAALVLLLIGGLAYSGGTIFHVLDGRWRWGAAAWHSAVLIGIATHFVAIFSFVIPVG
ncbi:MAG: hemolysin [Aliidongia sp.]|nr:hemolysin [Aliidongia sp.]